MYQQSELYELQRKVFCSDSTIDLNGFPYWSLHSQLPKCTRLPARIPVGTVYLPFNMISVSECCYLLRTIASLPKDELLFIPHLRATDKSSLQALKALGFFFIETEGESLVYYRENNILDYLRNAIGGKKLREHLRLWRKSQVYSVQELTIDEVLNQSSLARVWADLFDEHERKYGNTLAVYGTTFLNGVAQLSSKDEYRFHFRSSKEIIFQVYLTRRVQGILYLIASASRPQMNPNGVNFYTSMMMEMLKEKDRLNYEILHLGRGNKNKKISYGANRYISHIHAIYTKDDKACFELTQGGHKSLCGI